jgi:hypothetical protein
MPPMYVLVVKVTLHKSRTLRGGVICHFPSKRKIGVYTEVPSDGSPTVGCDENPSLSIFSASLLVVYKY